MERLVLVEKFEELKTGMRVVAKRCLGCGGSHTGLLGPSQIGPVLGETRITIVHREMVGVTCGERTRCVSPRTVESHRTYRFAADLGIDEQLADEDNPYVMAEKRAALINVARSLGRK